MLEVRHARTDDHIQVARLWREMDELHARVAPAFFDPMGDETGDPFTLTAMRALLADRDALLLVVALPERVGVIGCAQIHLYDTPAEPGLTRRRRAYVTRVAVDPEQRRRGVGRLLMESAREWAKGRGATQLVLTVWNGNRAGEAFYRALGYHPLSQVLGIDLP